MAHRNIPVSAHIRKGKAVKQHIRTNKILPKKITKQSMGYMNTSTLAATHKDFSGIVDVHSNEYSMEGIDSIVGWDLSDALIENLDFSKIKRIEDCRFQNIYINKINFEGTEIVNSTFQEVKFNDVNFRNIKMVGCRLDNVRFSKSTMIAPHFEDSNLERIAFNSKSSIQDGVFEKCILNDLELPQHEKNIPKLQDTFFYNCEMKIFQMDYGTMQGGGFHESTVEIISYLPRFKNVKFIKCELPNLRLNQAVITDSTFKSCNISRFYMTENRFSGSTFEKVSFREGEINDTNFGDTQFDNCQFRETSLEDVEYPRMTFMEAHRILGVTEKQFEFLVLSGAIEVRDNDTLEKITSGFNLNHHHVPPWAHLDGLRINPEQ